MPLVSTPILTTDTLQKLREKLSGLRGDRIPQVITASKTWDPPSVANGATTTTTVTVTGAVAGQRVGVGFPFSAAFIASGYVSAADTVTVVIQNVSGGPVDLASGTLTVYVTAA